MEMKRHLKTWPKKMGPAPPGTSLVDPRRRGLSHTCLQEDRPKLQNTPGTVNYPELSWRDAPSLCSAPTDRCPRKLWRQCLYTPPSPSSLTLQGPGRKRDTLRFAFLTARGNRLFRKRAFYMCPVWTTRTTTGQDTLPVIEPGRMRVRRYHCHLRQRREQTGLPPLLLAKSSFWTGTILVLKYLPKSDEASFAGSRITRPSASAPSPGWDIPVPEAMTAYEERPDRPELT